MAAPTWQNPLGVGGAWTGNYLQPNVGPSHTGNEISQLIGTCPSYNCGGSLMRIGSSVYSGRCVQCGRQYDVDQFGNDQPMDSDLVPVDKYRSGKIGDLPWVEL
jgi:hypothetical protein